MDLKSSLIRDEGLRLMPYYCTAGVLTIGVGRAIGRRGITKGEALYLLDNDIARVQWELREALPFFASLTQTRQDVLTNMAFNLGTRGLLEFKRTLDAVREGRYAYAALSMLDSRWAQQVGKRADRLAHLMKEGQERKAVV